MNILLGICLQDTSQWFCVEVDVPNSCFCCSFPSSFRPSPVSSSSLCRHSSPSWLFCRLSYNGVYAEMGSVMQQSRSPSGFEAIHQTMQSSLQVATFTFKVQAEETKRISLILIATIVRISLLTMAVAWTWRCWTSTWYSYDNLSSRTKCTSFLTLGFLQKIGSPRFFSSSLSVWRVCWYWWIVKSLLNTGYYDFSFQKVSA